MQSPLVKPKTQKCGSEIQFLCQFLSERAAVAVRRVAKNPANNYTGLMKGNNINET